MVAEEVKAMYDQAAPLVGLLLELLEKIGVAESFLRFSATLIATLLAVGLCALTYYLLTKVVSPVITRIVTLTEIKWDDILFNPMMLRAWSELVTSVLILFTVPPALSLYKLCESIALLGAKIAAVMAIVHLVNRFVMAVYDLVTSSTSMRTGSLKGIRQMIQILSVCVGAIVIISLLINRSPLIILSGLGASAAVLMLVFKDSILGLVAGVQLTLNDMLRPGDWITAPKYGVNGVVVEVTLTTVKIRNFDMTIVTVPPYSLVSESFQNWRGMKDSGGRRVKRSICIDLNSVRFLTPQEENDYLDLIETDSLTEEIAREESHRADPGRKTANITVFRRYLERFISHLPSTIADMPGFTCMVRELEPTPQGLPVEIYFFTSRQEWVDYEHLQADIIDHIVAKVPEFGLRIYQAPSGLDLLALARQ